MRKTFAEIIQSPGVDYQIEYDTLWNLFNRAFKDRKGLNLGWQAPSNYEDLSFKSVLDLNFIRLPSKIRKTYRSLETFNNGNKFYFGQKPLGVDLDFVLSYLEYTLSLIFHGYSAKFLASFDFAIKPYVEHCKLLANQIGHTILSKDDFVFLVPQEKQLVEVARLLPDDLSYKTFMYRHREMTGNLQAKKETLVALGSQLEPRRAELPTELGSTIFGLLNNCDIRHNNVDPHCTKNYHEQIAKMDARERESLYDDVYELMLLAFMSLDGKPIIEQRRAFLKGL